MVCMRKIFFLLLTTGGLLIAWTAILQAAGETVLLGFSSPSCGPCHQMRPTIQQLIQRGYPIQEIDISRNAALKRHYKITQVPAFVVLVNSQEFARSIGPASYIQLERMLQRAGIQPGRQSHGAIANPFSDTTARTSSETPPQLGLPADNATLEANAPNGMTTNVNHLLESTVRLTIQDPQGNSTGTGTIIEAREGEALVLTCGHLFRASGGQGTITITLFQTTGQGGNTQGAQVHATLEGQLVDFDLERDLGLVSFRTNEKIQVAPIAPIGTQLAPGSPVTTVGCNHGDNPTAIFTKVTSLNRYQGPANVEAAIAPVEGRSGGGMFNQQGQLVGVCFAADPPSNKGLYSATSSIHTKLNDLGLEMVYLSPSSQTHAVRGQDKIQPVTPSNPTIDALTANLTTPQPSASNSWTAPPINTTSTGQSRVNIESLNPSERALLEELDHLETTSEIILIIQPQTPGGKSEVIKLQHASPNLIRALVARRPKNDKRGSNLR
ncbi:MAG: trypsin-like peptidase domain-containing protein [Pirellulales bacterium]